jgi:hypothetical protein
MKKECWIIPRSGLEPPRDREGGLESMLSSPPLSLSPFLPFSPSLFPTQEIHTVVNLQYARASIGHRVDHASGTDGRRFIRLPFFDWVHRRI